MSLFGKKKERLRGAARVVSVSMPAHNAQMSNIVMDIVVEVPGVPAYAHHYKKSFLSVSKWPSGYETLPVSVDPDDHDDVDVLWDEIKKNAETAQQSAEQLAAMMRAQSAGAGGASGTIAPAEGGGFAPPPGVGGQPMQVVAGNSSADPVDRLAKLAGLRDAGVIDQAQFEQLRAQILGQAGLGEDLPPPVG